MCPVIPAWINSYFLFVDVTLIDGQNVILTCNYSTPYPIPESTGYYLYDGISLTINSYYRLTAAVPLQRVRITRTSLLSGTTLFNGFFAGGTPACEALWLNRCSQNTFDQDASCDPCEFSVTLFSYNTSTDDASYVSVVTTTSSETCALPLTGNNLCSQHYICS